MPQTAATALTPLFTLLRDAGGLRVFVETATDAGDLAYAAGDVFDTVITMASDRSVYDAAHDRLSGRKGILPLFGHSQEMVPNLLPRLASPAVFWLNASLQADTALPPELAAVLDAPLRHIVCLPGTALPPAALEPLLSRGTPRLAGQRDDVTILVPRDNTVLTQTLFPAGA